MYKVMFNTYTKHTIAEKKVSTVNFCTCSGLHWCFLNLYGLRIQQINLTHEVCIASHVMDSGTTIKWFACEYPRASYRSPLDKSHL